MTTTPFRTAAQDLDEHGAALIPQAIGGPLLSDLQERTAALLTRFADGYRSADYWTFDKDGSTVLYRVHNLEQQGVAEIDELFAGGPLQQIAGELLGGPVRGNVIAMVVKQPVLAEVVPWHRDRVNVEPGHACNLSLFLDAATPENGCLEVVRGSHRLTDDVDVEAVRAAGPVSRLPVRAGDVLAHDVRIVHGSGRNTSSTLRRSIVIEFERTRA